MLDIESRRPLDPAARSEIAALVREVAGSQGYPPLGERKLAQLAEGHGDWAGIVARDGERLAGYAHVLFNARGDHPRAAAEVVVHPGAPDGSGRALLDAAQAEVARDGGGVLFLWAHQVTDARDTLGAQAGFAVQRELALMSRDLTVPPEPASPPEGVILRPFRPSQDDEAFLAVNNAAFAGHPEQGGWDLTEFRRRQAWDWFDPDGLIIAWRGALPLGFHWTKRYQASAGDRSAAPVGEVYVLGVRPGAQAGGLGRALLDAGLLNLHDRGCRSAILYVDTASTAAVALYESAGFGVRSKEVCYESEVPPGPWGSSL